MPSTGVNKNYSLSYSQNDGPIVTAYSGQKTKLPDNAFGRWYARVHFSPMQATNAGKKWFLEANPAALENINNLNFEPKLFQTLALTRMMYSNCALWLDMGLGKTFITLAYCLLQYQKGLGNVFLIICPVSVFVTWEDEIEKHIKSDAKVRVLLAHGHKKKKLLQELRLNPTNVPTFVITSYETLSSIQDEIILLPLYAVIFDESSKIKNFTANRTKSAHKLIKTLPHTKRFCLSGTPSTANPVGFYSQYEILGTGYSGSPDLVTYQNKYLDTRLFVQAIMPEGRPIHAPAETQEELDSWLQRCWCVEANNYFWDAGYRFSRYPANKQNPFRIQILRYYRRTEGFKNLDQLNIITRRHAYSLKKEDVLLDLPEKSYVRRIVKMTAEQKKAYSEITKTNATILGEKKFSFSDKSSPHAKLHQIANGFLIGEDSVSYFKNDPKLLELEQILEESGGQKIVVWCAYRPQITAVCAFLAKKKIPHKEIHGGIPVVKRKEIVRLFTGPDAPRVLVANPDTAGMGLNMTWASLEIFMSIWFKPDVRSQAEDRCIMEEEPILTPNGWTPIENISIGDYVVTKSGTLQKVTAVKKRSNRKIITEISVIGWYRPLRVTYDHKIHLEKGWLQAQFIQPGDRLSFPKCAFPIKKELKFNEKLRIPNTFLNTHNIRQRNGRLIHAPSSLLLTNDSLFMLGYFAGDGFTSEGKTKGSVLGFAGNQTNKLLFLKRIKKYFKTHGLSGTISKNKISKSAELRFYSKEWMLWFQDMFGKNAKNKKLPIELLNLEQTQAKNLLHGLMASDGYSRGTTLEYSTASKILAAHVALVICCAGFKPSVRYAKQANSWIVSYSKSEKLKCGLVTKVTHHLPAKKKGIYENCYDLTVENEHNFILGTHVVHNCHRIGQKNAVTVIDILSEGTMELRLLTNTYKKIDTEDYILSIGDILGETT